MTDYINELPKDAKQINGSLDYVDKNGNIYAIERRKCKNIGKYFIKKQNKVYGYKYCGIYSIERQANISTRIHRIVATMFIPNPNNYPIVMHINNNKSDNRVKNLKWGTISENTQQAVDDKLMVNDKSWEDSQSMPCTCYDTLTNNLIGHYGSYKEASRELNISATTISNQINNILPIRKDKYFVKYNQPPRKHDIIIEYDFETDKEICRYANKGQAEKETNRRITYTNRKPYRKLSDTYFLKVLI